MGFFSDQNVLAFFCKYTHKNVLLTMRQSKDFHEVTWKMLVVGLLADNLLFRSSFYIWTLFGTWSALINKILEDGQKNQKGSAKDRRSKKAFIFIFMWRCNLKKILWHVDRSFVEKVHHPLLSWIMWRQKYRRKFYNHWYK